MPNLGLLVGLGFHQGDSALKYSVSYHYRRLGRILSFECLRLWLELVKEKNLECQYIEAV